MRKILGLILILLVPIAVVLPGIPGDVMLITGLFLISDKVALFVKKFLVKYKKQVLVVSTLWLIIFWSFNIYLWLSK